MTTVTATTSTRFVTSADGTAIAYDVTGTGPVGVPASGVMMMRVMPVWKKLCGVAPTLPHDYALVLGHQQGEPLPAGWLSGVTVPTLVIVGGKSPLYMKNGQKALAAALPHGTLRELPGQTHMVKGKATVPALREFWAS